VHRLYVGGEDYGTASDRVAEMWLEHYREKHPDESPRIEPCGDDEPVFLRPPAIVAKD
jgi:hypothetical protein